jgi:hypothetical protein
MVSDRQRAKSADESIVEDSRIAEKNPLFIQE